MGWDPMNWALKDEGDAVGEVTALGGGQIRCGCPGAPTELLRYEGPSGRGRGPEGEGSRGGRAVQRWHPDHREVTSRAQAGPSTEFPDWAWGSLFSWFRVTRHTEQRNPVLSPPAAFKPAAIFIAGCCDHRPLERVPLPCFCRSSTLAGPLGRCYKTGRRHPGRHSS